MWVAIWKDLNWRTGHRSLLDSRVEREWINWIVWVYRQGIAAEGDVLQFGKSWRTCYRSQSNMYTSEWENEATLSVSLNSTKRDSWSKRNVLQFAYYSTGFITSEYGNEIRGMAEVRGLCCYREGMGWRESMGDSSLIRGESMSSEVEYKLGREVWSDEGWHELGGFVAIQNRVNVKESMGDPSMQWAGRLNISQTISGDVWSDEGWQKLGGCVAMQGRSSPFLTSWSNIWMRMTALWFS